MLKFNHQFKIGTKVLLDHDRENFVKIKEINETRNLIKVEKWMGSYQRGHVIKFKNN